MENSIKNNNAETQDTLYVLDKKTYGDAQKGLYKGYTWNAKRHPRMHHWCGYFDDSLVATKHTDKLAHGGLTTFNGFDCAHFRDYVPGDKEMEFLFKSDISKEKTYKDFPFVRQTLYNIIDQILEN